MNEIICNFSYFIVGIAVIVLTIYRLSKGSREFFTDHGQGSGAPAAYMARFVVIGFCLSMTGYLAVTGSVQAAGTPPDQLLRKETVRAGFLMLVLGIDLLLTMFVLANLRSRAITEAPKTTA